MNIEVIFGRRQTISLYIDYIRHITLYNIYNIYNTYQIDITSTQMNIEVKLGRRLSGMCVSSTFGEKSVYFLKKIGSL